MSADVQAEVAELSQRTAREMAADVRSRYPVGPVHWKAGRQIGGGTLRDSVIVGQPGRFSVTAGGRVVPAAVVRVGGRLAPHVHFYEDGTATRFDPTRDARRGRMPAAGPIFIQTAIRHREEMLTTAASVLARGREIG